ncbi:MAG TPA: hypothetical protein VJ300_07315 [Thermoplasmata archaeon]|nr:hypothetical protein [Thermoplasmata archaeon]
MPDRLRNPATDGMGTVASDTRATDTINWNTRQTRPMSPTLGTGTDFGRIVPSSGRAGGSRI